MPKKLTTWWEAHKIEDAARVAREIKQVKTNQARIQEEVRLRDVKEKLIAEFTDDERRALGFMPKVRRPMNPDHQLWP